MEVKKLDSIEVITKKIREITQGEDFIFRGENKNYDKITSSLYRETKRKYN